jgi:transglutaminase-like putative cysteine protease
MVRIKSILSVLGCSVALIGYLPLQPYLGPFARWSFPVALLAGWYQERSGRFLSGRVLTPVSILLFVYFAAGFDQEHLLSVTADLLVVFLAIRMLGEKSARHYLQIFALSLFCLAASSLYNLSALFLVYLLALLLLLAVSLVILTFHAQDAELSVTRVQLKKVLGVAGLMPVASLPILLVLFVLLPRTQYPLWNFLNRGGGTSTGFSETVKPGTASSVSEVKNAVLRAMSRKVPEGKLYWRGIVLNGFQENAWIRLPGPREKLRGPGPGEGVVQEIYPEPSATPYLLSLNLPRQITGVRYGDATDLVFRSRQPVDRRIKYQAVSTLSDTLQVIGGIDRDFYLLAPERVSPRLLEAAHRLNQPGLSDAGKLARLETFLRGQRVSYANTGLPVGPDALDEFLFSKKRGNCEFFASSGAILLRLAGVPARLVGGYRGGTYNEMGGYYLVTEDMAHVWMEVYLDGKGWVTIDPSSWAVGFSRPAAAGRTVQMYVDALGFYWNKAVITYDLEKQISLLRNVGGKARQFRIPGTLGKDLMRALMFLVPVGLLVGWFLKRPATEEERLLRRFRRAVRRLYPEIDLARTGLFELAQQTGDQMVQEFVVTYGAALYGDRRLRQDELVRLDTVLRRLKQHHP